MKKRYDCPTCEDRGFIFVEGTEDQPDGPEVLDCPVCFPRPELRVIEGGKSDRTPPKKDRE